MLVLSVQAIKKPWHDGEFSHWVFCLMTCYLVSILKLTVPTTKNPQDYVEISPVGSLVYLHGCYFGLDATVYYTSPDKP